MYLNRRLFIIIISMIAVAKCSCAYGVLQSKSLKWNKVANKNYMQGKYA